MTGEEIKKLRIKAGITQQALGDGIGVSQDTVWNWESGRKKASPRHSAKAEQFLKSVIAQNKRADSLTETLIEHQIKSETMTALDSDTEYQKGYKQGYKDGVQAEIKAISDKFKLNI